MATIVIIDDDRHVRASLENLLDSAEYSTRSFAAGEALLAEHGWVGADCLVLDVRMKGMSGLELQQALLDRGCRTPIVFLTAQGDDETRKRALANGARAFLTKPFDEDQLLAVLDAAVRSSGEATDDG